MDKVYIIDPDISSREFLYELISSVGYGVLTFPGGKEALERLKKERPNLVLVSEGADEWLGELFIKKIRAFDSDIKIILLANSCQEIDSAPKNDFLRLDACLEKNFQDPQFIKNILTVLKQESFLKTAAQAHWGKILIVDDEPESRLTVSGFLNRRGFETETAESGEECLEKVKLRFFDLILLDITMGGMDGLLTLKRILDFAPKTRVVMVSAIHNQEVLDQAKQVGASDYIIKPFNFGTLEASLLSLLLKDKIKLKGPQGS